MVKLCFKKIVIVVLYTAAFFALVFVLAFLLNLLLPNLLPSPVEEIVLMSAASLVLFFATFSFRMEKATHKASFVKHIETHEFKFLNDMKNSIVSSDNIAYVAAITILYTPFFISVAISAKASIITLLVGTLLLALIVNGVFSFLNGFLWYIIHKIWWRQKREWENYGKQISD